MLGRLRSKETFSQGETMATSFSADSTFRPSGSGPSSISPRRRSGVGFVAAIRWPAHCAEDLDFAQLRVVGKSLFDDRVISRRKLSVTTAGTRR